jgi:hypothetical protein
MANKAFELRTRNTSSVFQQNVLVWLILLMWAQVVVEVDQCRNGTYVIFVVMLVDFFYEVPLWYS